MFLNQGIKSVRMDDIATQLGVSKRTLYEMFSDKKELLAECVKYHMLEKHAAMSNMTSDRRNVVEEIFAIIYTMKRDEKDQVFIGNLKKFYPDIYHKLEEEAYTYSYEQLDELLDRGVADGVFLPDMNKRLALTTLIYTMASLFEKKYYLPGMENISPRAAFEYIVVNFFRGLATQKGIVTIDELVEKHKKDRGQ